MNKPRFMPKTDTCAYLFRSSNQASELGLEPDMHVATALLERGLRVQDLLDALEDLAPHTYDWYTELKATRDCPKPSDSSQ